MSTTNTPFEDRIDEILHAFAKRVESIPRGKTYSWEAEKQALTQLHEAAVLAELEAMQEEQATLCSIAGVLYLRDRIAALQNDQLTNKEQ